MQLQFFPSRTVTLYTGRMFLVRTFGVLAGLVLILMTLDLLGESDRIFAYPGNGEAQLWTYVGLRVPQIISTFLKFSVLLGTLITLTTLNQSSEVISMKSAGLSAHQILAPLVVAGMLVAVASFIFNERVVARSTATLTAWQKADYGPMPRDSGVLSNLWVRDGEDLIRAGRAIGRGPRTVLEDITLYDRVGNSLARIVEAKEGRYVDGAWQVTDATRFDVGTGSETQLGTIRIAAGVTPDRFTLSSVDPDGLSFVELRQAIADLNAAGRPTRALEANLLRVDGKLIWKDSLRIDPARGAKPFDVELVMKPFVLGADLYRLEVSLTRVGEAVDRFARVFEVVDSEGQFGGKPLLLLSPDIAVRAVVESGS